LRVFNASYNEVGNPGVAALAAAPHLNNLRQLALSGCKVSDAGARALARANLGNLTRLDLIHDCIQSKGVIALAGSPGLAKLTWLELSVPDKGEGAGNDGVRAIAESPHLANLAFLGLKCNNVGDEAAIALAQSPHLRLLRVLDVEHNQIGERGALALAEAPWLDNLALLDIGGNAIGRTASLALRERLGVRVKLDEPTR
jgi:Ran GTPase-activating protein (RanGAP) involved in mRNA processing and transport